MFKITKAEDTTGFGAPPQGFVAPDPDLISHYCRIESWTADLATGVFQLGPAARQHHGLESDGSSGLLTLVRCYYAEHRQHVLELFEVAAMGASSFCFSTTIVHADDSHIPVMCVGESSRFSDNGGGTLNGIFLFARFKTGQTVNASNQ